MAHYAKIENNIVTRVIVAEAEFFDDFIDDSPGTWIKASINTRGGIHYAPYSNDPDDGIPLRKNYAGIGFSYDAYRDAFIPPQPFSSWVIDESTCLWKAPVDYPDDGNGYTWNEKDQEWNESDQQWDEVSI